MPIFEVFALTRPGIELGRTVFVADDMHLTIASSSAYVVLLTLVFSFITARYEFKRL